MRSSFSAFNYHWNRKLSLLIPFLTNVMDKKHTLKVMVILGGDRGLN